MSLDALTAEVSVLAGMEPAALADAQSVQTLYREIDRLQAVAARAVARFDKSGDWQLDGARTTASWIAWRCHRPHAEAKADLALARALRDLPASEAAWMAGEISAAHVRVLAQLRRPATAAQLSADEESLVGHAKTLPLFHQFKRVVAYWEQHVDLEGCDRGAAAQRDKRHFRLSESFQGMWFGDLLLDPISGQIVSTQLEAIVEEFFKADWAAAKARLGCEPHVSELGRTPGQRRADALVEMAIRAATAPADARRPAPLFTVLVDWETFKTRMCELDNGTVVAPGAVAPWLKAAWIERVVFGAPSRVIDVGHARRLFTGATRRAVEVRDRECFHETCDVPASQCQADHIIPFADGGPTTQDNGRMACGVHNRARAGPRPPKEAEGP